MGFLSALTAFDAKVAWGLQSTVPCFPRGGGGRGGLGSGLQVSVRLSFPSLSPSP